MSRTEPPHLPASAWRRGALALTLLAAPAWAATVVVTPPPDLTYPADGGHPLVPAHVLDLESEVAPDGVQVETIPDTGSSILTPPDVVILQPAGRLGPLGVGEHRLDWNAVSADTPPGGVSASQQLLVLPRANFGSLELVKRGLPHLLEVWLTAPALPGRPVEIPFTVGGTASAATHSAIDGVITIAPGERYGSYLFTIDGAATTNSTIVFDMAPPIGGAVAGYSRQTFRVISSNFPANVEIGLEQGGRPTRLVALDGGPVTVTARVHDRTANPATIVWTGSDPAIAPALVDDGNGNLVPPEFDLPDYVDASGNLQEVSHSYTFDPATLAADTFYTITAEVKEGDTSLLNFLFRTVATAPALTAADSDGDGIDDQTEGAGDADNDGVPDFLDAVALENLIQASPPGQYLAADNSGSVTSSGVTLSWNLVQQSQVSNRVPYGDLIATEPGLKIEVGALAFAADPDPADDVAHARIPIARLPDLIATLPGRGYDFLQGLPDAGYTGLEPYIFDVEVSDIAPDRVKRNIHIVIPLLEPISDSDTGALELHLVNKTGFWRPFDKITPENKIFSAYRDDKGNCPPPGSDAYLEGLTHGHDCLQLRVEENSIYDADGLHNGRLRFIGGLFKPRLTDCVCDFTLDRATASSVPPPGGNLFSVDGLVTDVAVSNIPADKVDAVDIVVPLTAPLPANDAGPLTYYIVDDAGVWRPFESTASEVIASAERDGEGYCPKPGDTAYLEGLHQGAECLQLTVLDNSGPGTGVNDTDPAAGVIRVRGAIFAPGLLDSVAPTLTLAPDLLLTSQAPVEIIDFATIVDSGGAGFTIDDDISGTSRVDPDGSAGPFPPGRHELVWKVTDLGFNATEAIQLIEVLPSAQMAADQEVVDQSTITVRAYLNGPALPGRPVTLPLLLGGDTTAVTASASTITIAEGERSGAVTLTLGDKSDGSTFTVTLDGAALTGAVAGERLTQTITVRDNGSANRPPVATLVMRQGGAITRRLTRDGGEATITVTASDATPTGQPTRYRWENPYPELQPLSGTGGATFTFDPATLADGLYTLDVVVGDGLDESRHDLTFSVEGGRLATLPAGDDSDDDGTDDATEGRADDDNDGIPNHLDAIANPEWLQAWPLKNFVEGLLRSGDFQSDNFKVNWRIDTVASNRVAYSLMVVADPGLRLGIGPTAFGGGLGHARIPIEDAITLTGVAHDEAIGSADGYVVDLEVGALPAAGQSVTLTLPQIAPLPPGGTLTFQIFKEGRWQPFALTATDRVASGDRGPGNPGYCPTDPAAYAGGLATGHTCVQVTISDGGPNDGDGRVNGTIRLFGGVFTTLVTPPEPEPEPYPTGFGLDAEQIDGRRNDGGEGGGGAVTALLAAALLASRRRRVSRS